MGRLKGVAPPPPTPRRCLTGKRSGSSGSGSSALSILTAFDDLVRNCEVLTDGSCEKEFLRFVKFAEDWRRRWALAEVECQRLRVELTDMVKELSGKDFKIKQARNIVEDERKRRQAAEIERDSLRKQMEVLKDIVLRDIDNPGNNLNDETKEKIRMIEKSFIATKGNNVTSCSNVLLNSPLYSHQQSTTTATMGNPLNRLIEESAESILDASDLSYDETCNNDESRIRRKKSINTTSNNVLDASRRRSTTRHGLEGERIVATTTVSVIDGKAHAESVIESHKIPEEREDEGCMEKFEERAKKSRRSRESRRVTYNDQPMEQEFEPSAPPIPMEQDDLMDKKWKKNQILSPISPNAPSPYNGSPFTPMNPVKRTFSNAGSIPNRPHCLVRKKVFKEEDCGPCGGKIKMGKSRFKCRDCGATAHMDCRDTIPLPCVPASLTPIKLGKFISDYTPFVPPMVPALLIHCIREIEARGLSEVGLYRISGTEKDSNDLLDKFMRNKGAPSLCKYDINTITSCVKKFLRSLKEPLVPHSLWRCFVDASANPDTTDAEAAMYQCISELPQPNRDTMAFLILHLQKIAQSPDCKMGSENLARVFGPTIVGYSSSDPCAMLSETPLQKGVMATLLGISSDYWRTFVNVCDENVFGGNSSVIGFLNGKNTPDRAATGFLQTPLRSAGPSERKSKKLRSLHKQNFYFQSPMLS